jgi:hypothetical protein
MDSAVKLNCYMLYPNFHNATALVHMLLFCYEANSIGTEQNLYGAVEWQKTCKAMKGILISLKHANPVT